MGLAVGLVGAMLAVGTPALAQVQVQTLAAPDMFSIGVGPSDLPTELWQGSSAALARLLFPVIKSRPLTPAAAALARHVLSSPAPAPEGAGDDAELVGERAQALLALGETAAVAAIVDRTPSLPQRPALSRAAAQAALIRGEEDKACAIGDALAVSRDGAFWLRLRAYCQARAGQGAPAQLTLDLIGRQEPNSAFDHLMTALLTGKQDGAPTLDDGLDFALSKRAVANWPSGLAGASLPVALTVAKDATAPLPARLEAAARAARLGFVAPEAFAASPPADASVPVEPGAAGEAGLVALAKSTNDLTLKETAVIMLLKRAGENGQFQAMARMAQPHIVQLLAAGAVLREPALFAMAAATAGDVASAKAARAQAAAGSPAAARPAPLDLGLLDALIAGASGQPDASAVDALDALYAPADAAGRANLAASIALLGALGAPVGPQARFDVSNADLGSGPGSSARLQALKFSAAAGRMGDTALYSLAIFADAGAAGPSPTVRAATVQALRQTGLKADAQALAVEGLLALQGPQAPSQAK